MLHFFGNRTSTLGVPTFACTPTKALTKMKFRKYSFLRIASTLAWTVFAVFVMATSSNTTLVGNLHKAGGGTEVTDAMGHVAIFGILAFLWWWSLIAQSSQRNALFGAAIISLPLGIIAEIVQVFVPDRGVTLFDLLSNCLGIIIVLVAIGVFQNKVGQSSITTLEQSISPAKKKSHRSNDPL
jgi:VanZ family protein